MVNKVTARDWKLYCLKSNSIQSSIHAKHLRCMRFSTAKGKNRTTMVNAIEWLTPKRLFLFPNRVFRHDSNIMRPAKTLPTVRLFLLSVSFRGTSKSVIFLACNGQMIRMVSRSSSSAVSISSAVKIVFAFNSEAVSHLAYQTNLPARILIFKFSRINANNVVVKLTFLSSPIGIFMRTNFL